MSDAPRPTGVQLLDRLDRAARMFIAFSSEHDAVAFTLFAAATHGQPAWEHATRLVFTSPLRRCGKTRAQDVCAYLSHKEQSTVNISVAALVRSIDEHDPPTLHLDEYDTVFGKVTKEGAEDLRGIINAGFRRGKPYRRWNVQTREQEVCPNFCMVTLAGIGDLPDTVEDRAVVLHMRRRAKSETVSPFRERRDRPRLEALRDLVHAWVRANIEWLKTYEPSMPVEDRDRDKWEPLVAVADLAGCSVRSGTYCAEVDPQELERSHARCWPARARAACRALCAVPEADDATLGERLLYDLQVVFRAELASLQLKHRSASAVPSQSLVNALCALEESPWGDLRGEKLDQRILARLLRPYRVKSKPARYGDRTFQSYHFADLVEAWNRYCPPVDPTRPNETGETGKTMAQNPWSEAVSGVPAPSETGVKQDGWRAAQPEEVGR